MRATLDKFLSKLNHPDIYLLHGDLWHYTWLSNKRPANVIDLGMQEPNIVNFATGLAYKGKTVFVYGVAGMILHRGYEQIKLGVKGWAENRGNIIFVNSGHNGCYVGNGRGHQIDDDERLCEALNIPLHTPSTQTEFLHAVKKQLRLNCGVRFIRFGFDDCEWI